MIKDKINKILGEIENAPEKPLTSWGLASFARRLLGVHHGSQTNENNTVKEVPIPETTNDPVLRTETLCASSNDVRDDEEADAKKIEELNNEIHSWRKAYDELEAREKAEREENNRIQEDLERYRADYDDLQSLLKKAEDEKQEQQEKVQKLNSLLDEAEQKALSSTQQAELLTKELQTTKQKHADLLGQMSDLEQSWKLAEKDLLSGISHLKAENQRLSEHLSESRQVISTLQTEREDLQVRMKKESEQSEQKINQLTEAHRQRLQEMQSQRNTLSVELKETKQSYQELSAAHSASEQEIEKLRNEVAAGAVLMNRMWPECVRIPDLKAFDKEWKAELMSPGTTPSLLFMYANIFIWACAAEMDNRDDADNSIDVMATGGLYNFSRFLLDWLYDHHISDEAAADILYNLAERMNPILAPLGYMLEVPMIDAPFSAKSMTIYPTGRNSGCVASVRAWGIKSINSAIYKKKSIVKLQ